MIEFLHPWVLIALFFIPFLFWLFNAKSSYLEGTMRISSSTFLEGYFRIKGERRYKIILYLKILTLVLIIVAIARPRKIDQLQMMNVDVVDIILVIDISSSMLAEDFKPNRLEAVKEAAQQFIANRVGDRIGLLVFAGETFIQCPLTTDNNVLSSLLKDIRIAEKEYDGTAIGMAIANATNRLRDSKAKSKVMILLSDGSNNAGELDPITAADLASQFEIKIYTIGAATDQSLTYIPGIGRMINEIDEKTLKEIANETGGKYFRAKDQDMLSEIYAQIDGMERTEIEVKSYTKYKELFGWFLIPALMIGMSTETLNRTIFNRQT
ncbi:MAG: VWA domain-containing protein [Candidatus Neomarinimicrobiota bacterium]|nr:VWA domain-containing protein [Candidatus Neomarinimicrobiota bacterium]